MHAGRDRPHHTATGILILIGSTEQGLAWFHDVGNYGSVCVREKKKRNTRRNGLVRSSTGLLYRHGHGSTGMDTGANTNFENAPTPLSL